MNTIVKLHAIHQQLKSCRKCPKMCSSAIHGPAIKTKVMIIGQAPGIHEPTIDKPFAYTAGKTLFKWLFQAINKDEDYVRKHIYFAAVARCFPGKAEKGSGDREPTDVEIANCRSFLYDEVQTIKPKVIIAVGKLAIREVLGTELFNKTTRLHDVIGKVFKIKFHGVLTTVIPLPHPSGVSSWPHRSPGKELLALALNALANNLRL